MSRDRRFGKEITFYSVWFELRWGITGCLILTVGLITTIFYNHPSTTNVTLFFRTIPILSETNGRVAEIYVGLQRSDRQGRADLPARQLQAGGRRGNRAPQDRRGRCGNGGGADRYPEGRRPAPGGAGALHQQTVDELETKQELQRRNPGGVALRDIERLEVAVEGPPGRDRCRHGRKAGRRDAGLDRAPGREGQRRSRAGPGRGGTGQDGRPCRRERARGAVLRCAWAISSIRSCVRPGF